MFEGLSAFPPTPTDETGKVDTVSVARLAERLAAEKVDSIGLLGSTGGYAFLTREERRRAVEAAANAVGNRVPLLVGVGAMRTDEAQALARDAAGCGASALLLAPVSYTPLAEEEVYQHFAAVAGATNLPLVIYNNPTTTRFTFSGDLIERLSQLPTIVSVKMPLPANGGFVEEIASLRSRLPAAFAVGYSGDWGAREALLAGADTWYSVVAGLLPKPALALTRAAQKGNAVEAARIDKGFEPLWQLFQAHGSFRVMYAVGAILGLFEAAPPRPVLPISEDAKNRVEAALVHLASITEI